jgi:hypothetical protein
MFSVPELFFSGTEVSGPVFIFCAPGVVLGGTEGVRSRFHVLPSQTLFRRVPSTPVLMFCASGLVFGGTMGVGTRFHVLRSMNRFRRYRGRRVQFSCFAFLDSFSTIEGASAPFLMFYAPGHVFGDTECVGSRFHVLPSRTSFRWYIGRRVPFACVMLPDSFSAIPWALGPVFMFCAPELIFGDTVDVGSRFHILRTRTRFRRYRGSRVPFSFFALLNSFSSESWVLGPVLMFCAP